MRGPKPDRLNLTEVERNELEWLVRRHGTAQQVALISASVYEGKVATNRKVPICTWQICYNRG